MLVTLAEISTELNKEQPENADDPMLVTPDGIATELNKEQPENADAPMLVSLLPDAKVTVFNLEQL